MKTVPIFVSVIVSVVILFGGWLFYQSYYIEKPIENYFESLDGVKLTNMEVDKSQVQLDIQFSNSQAFLSHYAEIEMRLNQLSHGREVVITLPQENKELDQIWMEGYFFISEVIENKEYSRIPEVLKTWKKDYGLQTAEARMDNQFILIVLEKDKQFSYFVMPRDREEVNI